MLPGELTDKIVDILANDQPALLACSLTSRSWRSRSQAHLFQHVTLQQRYRTFTDSRPLVLSASPHIASLVRVLTMKSLLPSALMALPCLPRVETLTMENFSFPYNVEAMRCEPAFEDVLSHLGSIFPGLRTLSIRNLRGFYESPDNLFRVLLAFGGVQTIDISALRTNTNQQDLSPLMYKPLSLQSLILSSIPSSTLTDLHRLLESRGYCDISSLRRLEWQELRNEGSSWTNGFVLVTLVVSLVEHAGKALEELRVAMCDYARIRNVIRTLPNVRALRKVELCLQSLSYLGLGRHNTYALLVHDARQLDLRPDAELRLAQEIHADYYDDLTDWDTICEEFERVPPRCTCSLVRMVFGWEGTDASEVPVPECVQNARAALTPLGIPILIELCR